MDPLDPEHWPGEEAAEGEAQPGQPEAGQRHPPADELDHEELGPDPAHQDEQDQEEGHRLHAPDAGHVGHG